VNEAGGGIVTKRTFDPFNAFNSYVNEEYNVSTGVGPTSFTKKTQLKLQKHRCSRH
jgi:hypothetical protein